MKFFFKFIVFGLFFAAPGEFLSHIVLHHSWHSFMLTMASYAIIYLPLFYILSKLWRKLITNEFNRAVFCYIFFGLVGLAIEWFLIHNSPVENPQASQIGMFTFWTTLFMGPALLSDSRVPGKLRTYFLSYFGGFSVIYIILPLIFQSPTVQFIGIIIYAYGTWALNYFFVKYLKVIKILVK